MKVIYVVSTLAASGPTTQLYNLIKNLDSFEFKPYLVTLSPEPTDSLWEDYQELEIGLQSLSLSRVKGLFLAKSKLSAVIEKIKPDLIHTQGLRADSLLASLKLDIPWVMTSRNFPPDDYPSKYGRFKGGLMVWQHFSAMKRCQYLVACSKSIQKKLSSIGVQSIAIQNGVRAQAGIADGISLFNSLPRPIFVSVGSLIPRKNMQLLVEAFAFVPEKKRGSLVILGDGPLMPYLSSISCSNVYFLGNVTNVADYLAGADYFISSSLSEGLPNTVLEALSSGLPVILSDIEPHQEIASESEDSCKIFSLGEGAPGLSDVISNVKNIFNKSSSKEAIRIASGAFSAEKMSAHYQKLYKNILEG